MVQPGSEDDTWTDLARLASALVAGRGDFARLWTGLGPEIERWVRRPGFLGRVAGDEDHGREIVVRAWEQLQDRDLAKLRAFVAREPPTPGGAGAEPGVAQDGGSDPSCDGRRFRAFVHRVVKNIGIDYLRTLPEYVRLRGRPLPEPEATRSTPAAADEHKHWRSIVSLTSSVEAVASDAEGQLMARRMLCFLDESIAPARRQALDLALAGAPLTELAHALGLGVGPEARRAVERLRERALYRPALELWSQGFDSDEIAARVGLGDGAAADRLVGAAKELLRRHFRP